MLPSHHQRRRISVNCAIILPGSPQAASGALCPCLSAPQPPPRGCRSQSWGPFLGVGENQSRSGPGSWEEAWSQHGPQSPLSPSSSDGRLETLPPRSCVSSDTGAQPCPPKAIVPAPCLKHKSETLSCASAHRQSCFSVEWAGEGQSLGASGPP